jgi:hypothetical protein
MGRHIPDKPLTKGLLRTLAEEVIRLADARRDPRIEGIMWRVLTDIGGMRYYTFQA